MQAKKSPGLGVGLTSLTHHLVKPAPEPAQDLPTKPYTALAPRTASLHRVSLASQKTMFHTVGQQAWDKELGLWSHTDLSSRTLDLLLCLSFQRTPEDFVVLFSSYLISTN
jgi:hypothetical protein